MLTDEEKDTLLTTIARLGGKGIKDDDITYEGTKLVVPEAWQGALEKAIAFLNTKIKEENETATFVRQYNYRPYDGAICAFRAMKKAFGMVHGKPHYTWFGAIPPEYIQVPISSTEVEEVPWGDFSVPLLEGATIRFGEAEHDEYGPVFEVTVSSPRKHRFVIEGLFHLIQDELAKSSIYRGQAIDGQEKPTFLDLSALDPTKVIYSDQITADLEANIWAVLRYSEQHKQLGLPLKRAILLTGAYGTGKSLAGFLTAGEAVANSWTFIMARPGRDNFLNVMQTARLYQPCVVFFEDAESMTGKEQSDTISTVLDAFDGITAKGTNLMVVMTTNHPEEIHRGMLRPGRVDAVIEIGALDANGTERLIRAVIPPNMLADDVEFASVVEACEGYVPAFVKEVSDRAVRYALARTNGSTSYKIDTLDLVHAAQGLRPQYDRMTGAGEFATHEATIPEMIKEGTATAVADLASRNPNDRVWDPSKLKEARNNGD